MSPTIADSLPENTRREIAERSLVVGAVIRAYVSDIRNPKTKLFIVIGFDGENVGVVYINSEIDPAALPNPYLKSLHLPVLSADNEYLDHDSYIDCRKIYEKKKEDLLKILTENPSCHKGDITQQDLENANKTIKNARTIYLEIKRRYGIIT